MKYLLVLFFSFVFLGSFLIVGDTMAVTAWCKKDNLCQAWTLYVACEDGWTYIANAGESPCEQASDAVGDDSSGAASADNGAKTGGSFQNIGDKLKNVAPGFYGDVAPKSFEETVGGYIKTGLALVGVIFLLLMVYGGYTWMIARGDDTEAKKAKDTITMAAIGMTVVLIAYVITYFILSYAMGSAGL